MNKETNNNQKQIPQGFKQTDIGLIPEDWEVCSFKGNILYETGKRMKGGGLKIGEVMSIGGEHIDENGNLIYERMKYISREFYQKLQQGKVKEHNVILVKDGATTGKLAFIWKLNHELAINEHAFILRSLNEKRLINQFIYYGLLSELGQLQIKKHYHGLIGGINRGDLDKFKIPLPPLPEQKKIAYVLSKIQQAIEIQEKIIKTTQELKKALMQKLFTEGLNGEPQKQTEIGLIPQSWDVIELERTGDVVYGIQAAVAHLKKPIGLPILTNKNITLDGEIDLSELNYFELKTKRHFATILKKGDILFNWRSGSKEHVGKTAYFNLDGDYVHSSFILRIRPKSDVNNKYLFYYLSYLRLSEYFIKLHSYSINAKFNKSSVNRLPTAIPSIDIQEKVAFYLTNIDMKIKLEQSKLSCFKNLFNTSLNNLMTGQIRVKDIEFEFEETAEAVD
ncbi:MAG: restriction endonuclease subunit S [Ignavibacterium album]|uniref:restriction endonuclease subunit S n=1 Tax=Ignavibacterium album TaxID=591197 RepID=UPI0026ED9053|nr:restriction endonuclease subunit S [Ignavibacterium album]MBI5661050.1 restriction endonuclease subunit S [Ignavibacterium album]